MKKKVMGFVKMAAVAVASAFLVGSLQLDISEVLAWPKQDDNETIAALESKVDSLTTENSGLKDEISSLTTEKSDLEGQIDRLKDEAVTQRLLNEELAAINEETAVKLEKTEAKMLAMGHATRADAVLQYDHTSNEVTDGTLRPNTQYGIRVNLPDEFFIRGGKYEITVYYPETTKSGEHGTISIYAKDQSNNWYVAVVDYVADGELCLIHGSENADAYSGGDYMSGATDHDFSIFMYTSATSEHLRRPCHSSTTGPRGEARVEYLRGK